MEFVNVGDEQTDVFNEFLLEVGLFTVEVVSDFFGLEHEVVPITLELPDLVMLFFVELTVAILLHVEESIHILNGFELVFDV